MEVGEVNPFGQAVSNVEQESNLTTQNLGSDDFLELLITQLTNQNPLEPMEDTEFIAQMAQFTSLEQMKQLNSGFTDFSGEQRDLAAQNYLGREVTVIDDNGAFVRGTVSAVTRVRDEEGNATVELVVNNRNYKLSNVQEVRLATEEAS